MAVLSIRSRWKTAALLLLLGLPSAAQANMGTPLMWAGAFHLLVGNLVIGVLEGILLAEIFGASTKKCIALLILANYFSAWVGLSIAHPMARDLPMTLHSAWPLLWLMVAVTYVLTLILEFPFVAFAFRRDPAWRRKSIRGSLLIQTASYAVLLIWYSFPSSASLYVGTDVVKASSMSLPENVLVYFISVDDGDVYAGSLRERQWRRVLDVSSSRRIDYLFVRPSPRSADSWDLVASLGTGTPLEPNIITVAEHYAADAVPARRSTRSDPRSDEESRPNLFGVAPRLGDAQSSSWEFSAGFYPVEGLLATEANSQKTVRLSFETPFLRWTVGNTTHLPTDKALLQLGDSQICVYDPVQRQIALLTRGRGPIAVINEQEPDQTSVDSFHKHAPFQR